MHSLSIVESDVVVADVTAVRSGVDADAAVFVIVGVGVDVGDLAAYPHTQYQTSRRVYRVSASLWCVDGKSRSVMARTGSGVVSWTKERAILFYRGGREGYSIRVRVFGGTKYEVLGMRCNVGCMRRIGMRRW